MAEIAEPISIQHVVEGREEAMKRVGNSNLAAKEPSSIDFVKYLIENRIAANNMFPFLIIISCFIFIIVVLGTGWYCLGLINSDYSASESALFGLTNYEDALFMAVQVLSFGEWNEEIPKGKVKFLPQKILIFP